MRYFLWRWEMTLEKARAAGCNDSRAYYIFTNAPCELIDSSTSLVQSATAIMAVFFK
jgi:hypothetical protein